MKLKVGAKILLGFAVVLILLGVVAFFGVTGLTSVDDQFSSVLDKRIPVTKGVLIEQNLTNRYIGQVRAFMLYGKQDALDQIKTIKDERNLVEKDLTKNLTTEKGRNLLGKLTAASDKYDLNAQKIIELYKVGKNEQAGPYITEATKAANEFLAAADELTNLNDSLIKSNVSDAKNFAASKKQLSLILSIFATLLGIVIAFVIGRSISKPLVALTAAAQTMATGDLTLEIPDIKTKDETQTLGDAFKTMVANIKDLIQQINSTSNQVAATSEQLSVNSEETAKASQQVAKAIEEVARGTTEQTRNVTDTVRTVDQVTQAIEQIAGGAQEQNRNVMTTTELVEGMSTKIELMSKGMEEVKEASAHSGIIAKDGGQAVNKTVVGMERVKEAVFETANRIKELGEQSIQIGEIIQVIDEIAEQTNLLALNAAIEAARAGEHGKGFAVVADEVRKLAERSGKATKEIASLITNIQKGTNVAVESMEIGTKEVEEGVAVAQEAGKSLEEIVSVVGRSNEGVIEITKIIAEIMAASKEVSNAISNVAAITEENTAATEEISASTQQVSGAMQNISAITEESSAAAEEVSASTEEMTASVEEIASSSQTLKDMADNLNTIVGRFKI